MLMVRRNHSILAVIEDPSQVASSKGTGLLTMAHPFAVSPNTWLKLEGEQQNKL